MITEEFESSTDTVEEDASVEACTKCTACNTVCPVARATDIFRGPKALGPDSIPDRKSTRLNSSH